MYHFGRLVRTVILIVVLLALSARRRTYYLVPDGGFGVWYSLALATACSMRCKRLVLHHHTCRYVDQRDVAMSQITKLTRRVAEHVFLTPGMASAFEDRYGKVRHRVVGNAAFTKPVLSKPLVPSTTRGLVLGHLSNLCREKGFHEVCNAFEEVANVSDNASLRVAGPILERDVATRLQRLREQYGDRIWYVGPLDGAAKRAFYNSIDVFLFPTQFRQEAAPNVLYEAAASGVPSIAVARGMIREILHDLGGFSCLPEDNFPAFARRVLDSIQTADLRTLASEVQRAFVVAHRRDCEALEALVAVLRESHTHIPG